MAKTTRIANRSGSSTNKNPTSVQPSPSGHQPIQLGFGAFVNPIEAQLEAQNLFMRTACELEPELMKTFFREVYQSEAMKTEVWPNIADQFFDTGPLTRHIVAWVRTHLAQVDYKPRWLFDQAVGTIYDWQGRGISPLGCIPKDDELVWGYSSGVDYWDSANDPPVEIAYPIELGVFEWEPLVETKREAYDRILKALEGQLHQKLDTIEEKAGKVFWKNQLKDSARHYEWLARRLINRETVQQIAAHPGKIARGRGGTPTEDEPVEVRAVTKAIKPIATLLGLALPTRGKNPS